MHKVKCYLLSAPGEYETSKPVYYKIIGTYSEMDDYCSFLWSIGEEAEIDSEREATEDELNEYTLREDKDYPLVYDSIYPLS